jgi:hypothetical protein
MTSCGLRFERKRFMRDEKKSGLYNELVVFGSSMDIELDIRYVIHNLPFTLAFTQD